MPHLERDRVKLFYEEAGRGEPSVLFGHGAMNSHSWFAPQMDHFGRAHRSVAVDFRGHGESDKPRQDYSIEGFAEDLAWLAGQLGLDRPVVVGHSMGGAACLQLAASFPEVAAAVVVLDSPVVPPPAFGAAMGQLAEAAQTPGYRDAIRQFMAPFVGFQDDPDRASEMVEEMAAVPQHVTASVLQNYVSWDSAAAAGAVKAPVLYVSSGPWFTEVGRFRELTPQLVTGQTVGSGHYHQLEVPDQINAIIERFLRMIAQPA